MSECDSEAELAAELAAELDLTDRLSLLPEEALCCIHRHLPAAAQASFARACVLLRNASRAQRAMAAAELRERTRALLLESLRAGFEADNTHYPHSALAAVALQLDDCSAKKCRQLASNLKDPKNPEVRSVGACPSLCPRAHDRGGRATPASRCAPPDPPRTQLRQRLLSGALKPSALLQLSAQELASASLQQQRSEWHAKRMRMHEHHARLRYNTDGYTSDLYRCDNCHGVTTRIHRVVRAGRSVDRARTVATCIECAHRWEV